LKAYVVYGRYRYTDDFGAKTDWYDFNTPVNDPRFERCPSAGLIHKRQLAGWSYLLSYSADYLTNANKRAAHGGTYWLRDALGGKPYYPAGTKRPWDAHHIVPQRGRPRYAYDDVKALLFRACVHPNRAANGVYLRGSGLRRTRNGTSNPNYRKLQQYDRDPDTALAERTYHGDTFRNVYSDELHTALHSQLPVEDQTCSSGGAGGHDDVLAELSVFKTRLINGMYLGRPMN
jgi:hypothetical protein